MLSLPARATTRQRAYCEAHRIRVAAVVEQGVGLDGIEVVGRVDHSWAAEAIVTARVGDVVRVLLPYPDEATRQAALAARDGDFWETIGLAAAAAFQQTRALP